MLGRTAGRLFWALLLAIGCEGEIRTWGAPHADGTPDVGGNANPSCEDPSPLSGESQRLDPTELGNAVHELFPFLAPRDFGFPAPVRTNTGFSTYPSRNAIVLAQVGTIADAADAIALKSIDHLEHLLPCAPEAIDSDCVSRFIEDFAPRAFRGAYVPADGDRLRELFDALRTGSDALPPRLAVAGVISAILQSPGFLYLVESGTPDAATGARRLTSREIANRMAFVLWDAPPDQALLDAATEGRLDEASSRRTQAERMLEDPRAKAAIVRFFREWMGVEGKYFDDRVSPEVAAALEEELSRFVVDAVFEQGEGGFEQLVRGSHTFVNRSLAMHYGLDDVPPDDSTWQRVALPPTLAAGLLSRGSVAAAHSSTASTSFVLRGHFVREKLLCQSLGAPPPGATAENPILPESATVRDRIEARASMAACAPCHTRMDYVGIGMEDIDQVGRYRTRYADEKVVDARGELVGFEPSEFVGTRELGARIAESDLFATCTARKWFRYALGRDDDSPCQFAPIETALRSGKDLRALILSVVEAESFVLRTSPGDRR